MALKEEVVDIIKEFDRGSGFTARQVTDTPTDALSVVNRKYTNLNGAVASRPVSSVATVGQKYFATDTNLLMTYNTTGWYNGVGSLVAAA